MDLERTPFWLDMIPISFLFIMPKLLNLIAAFSQQTFSTIARDVFIRRNGK